MDGLAKPNEQVLLGFQHRGAPSQVYRGAGPPRVENLKYLTCAKPTLLPDYFIALAYTLEHPEPETIPCALAPNPIYHSYEAVEPPPLPQLIKMKVFHCGGLFFRELTC